MWCVNARLQLWTWNSRMAVPLSRELWVALCVESLLSWPQDNLSAQFSYFASQEKQSPLTIFVGSADWDVKNIAVGHYFPTTEGQIVWKRSFK